MNKLFYLSAIAIIGLFIQPSNVWAQGSEIEKAKELYQHRYPEAIATLETTINLTFSI